MLGVVQSSIAKITSREICLNTAVVLPRTRTSQVSHSSPSATPLPLVPHLRVVPVWGLTGLGALGTVWSTWSTTESHRTMNVRERLAVGTHHAHGRMHASASFLP